MSNAWLIEAVLVALKASMVLTGALAVTLLMRRRPAAERHLVWVAASVGVLALPLLSVMTPNWRVDVRAPAWFDADVSAVVVPAPVTPLPVVSATPMAIAPLPPVAPEIATTIAPLPPMHTPAPARVHAAPQPAPMAPPAAVRPSRSGVSPVGVAIAVLLVWTMGAAAVVGGLMLGMERVRRLVGRAQPLQDPALLVRARGLAAALGITRDIRLLEGAADAMPITFGILRPTLLLPSTAASWRPSRQEAVLRHELAHIRRRDSLTQLLAEVGCALYWFNPLMWWAARRLCVEREHACDDAVIVSGSRASDYAAELLDIARTLRVQRVTGMAAIAMARPSHLRTRLSAVLEDRRRSERASVRLLVPAWLGMLLVVTPLSSLAVELSGRGDRDVREPVQSTSRAPRAPRADKYASTAATAGAYAPRAQSHRDEQPTTPQPLLSLSAPAAGLFTVTSVPSLAAPPVAGLGVLALPEALQQDCLSGRNRSINNNTNDDRSTIKWSGSDCSGEVVVEGVVRFNDDFTAIAGISRDGFVRITSEEGRTERRVMIRPSGNTVAYEYWLNGDRRDFDAAGQAWVSNTLMFLFRRVGFMAEQRATAILERGGANAVLTEVGLLQGDHARAAYLRVLVDRGRLDETSLRRVLDLAGRTIDSDHYKTQIVTAVAGRYELTSGVRDAYINALTGLDSDHYRHVAFSTLLKEGRLSSAQVSTLLGEVRRIDSDHYRAALLSELGAMYASAPDIRPAYLEAAAAMSSDHYKANVLHELLRRGDLSAADLARVVEASAGLGSDHYKANVLTQVASAGLSDAVLQRAFVRAAAGMDSDHYLQQVLSHVVAREPLDRAALLLVLDAAGELDSDHYRANLLVEIAQRHRLDGEVRERFMKAMDDIDSETYRGRVASVLLRQSR